MIIGPGSDGGHEDRPTSPDRDGELAASLVIRLSSVSGDSDGDPVDARRELESIVRCADEHGLIAVAARARYVLARVLVSLGEAAAALELIDTAARSLSFVGAPLEALRTNLGRMHVLDDLGRHDEAVVIGRAAAAELAALGDVPDDDEVTWLRAAIEENTGVALGYVGRHAEALASYASAAACYDRLGARDDSARVSLNHGVELCELARMTEAIAVLEGALDSFVESGDRMNQALCLTNLSEAWIAAGRYLEAFRTLDAAASALRELDHTTDWMRAELARADCYVTLGLDVEALDLYDDLLGPLTRAGLKRDLAKVHLGRGTILGRTGFVADGRESFDAARLLFTETGDRTLLARTCLAMARTENDPGRSISTAIELLSDVERPAEYAIALLAGARHHEVSDPGRADEYLRLATELIRQLGVPELTWQLHHHTGTTLRRAGDRDGALAELRLAVATLNEIRVSLDRDGLRLHFDGARRDAVDDMIDLLLDAGDVDGAVALVDSMHGRGLAEAMCGVAPPADLTVHAELRSTYDRLLTARGPHVAELTSRARRLERQAELAPAESSVPLAIDDDRIDIEAGTVCYRIVQDEVIAFVGVEGTTHVVRKVCEVDRIEALLAKLVVQWRRFEHPEIVARHANRIYGATVDVLRDLHACLLAPVVEFLPDRGPLTVIADGPIGAVPFAALVDGDEFTVDRHAVRQTPSVGIDHVLRRCARSARSVLALGTADQFAPLAVVEAARVGRAWQAVSRRSVVLCGVEATADAFIRGAPDHDVVHIAGHGLFRNDAPEFSAIRLADRWVTAAEIARLELDGQLVVLSACDTGSRHATGPLREVVGLPRALLAAGARGVVASLWPIDDDATTQLMSALHHELARAVTDVEALRAAQLSTRASHPHPYYWASTILIGGAS